MSAPDSDAGRPAPLLASADARFKPDHLRFALDVGRSAVWSWQDASRDFSGDRSASLLWGLPDGQTLSTPVLEGSIHPDDAPSLFSELHRAAAPDGPDHCQLEFRIRRGGDGAERWIALQGRRFRLGGEAADEAELIGMARDVTARKQRETHVYLLMREVTHRSKNLLAIIQAMARQTVKDSLTAAEFEQRFSARLRGLAASHDLLAARDWHGAAVNDLVRWQLGPVLERAGDRVAISGPDLYLNPEAAQNIGLAINELASNASRFGALSGPTGRVAIAWSIDAEGAQERRFRIGWEESGGPEVSQPQRTGFGHKVTERLTARALDGLVSLSYPASGLRWSLDIPATFVLRAEDAPVVN